MNTPQTNTVAPKANTVITVLGKKLIRKIVVKRYAMPIQKPGQGEHEERQAGAFAQVRVRQRWEAHLVEGDKVLESVDGFTGYDDAGGELIRVGFYACTTHDEAWAYVGLLFDTLATRSASAAIFRAVWIAARSRHRRHRGVMVEFPEDMEFHGADKATISAPLAIPKPLTMPIASPADIMKMPKRAGKGGAA